MADTLTENNIYEPTPAEMKLMEVLLNPEHIGKNVSDICQVAGISRTKYYQAMDNKKFTDLLGKTSLDILKGKVSDIITASYKYALSDKGFQDRKMLLTMAGLYSDKQEITSENINHNLDYSNKTDAELRAEAEALANRILNK